MPNVRHIESEDGSCSLTYDGNDSSPSQAGGGLKYTLRVSHFDCKKEARGTVQNVTSNRAAKQADAEGLNYLGMGLTGSREYMEQFAEKYGRFAFVVSFEVINISDQSEIAELSKKFCQLYLIMHSAYRYNNSEYPESGEGYYPDEINFSPWDIDKKYFMQFQDYGDSSLNALNP